MLEIDTAGRTGRNQWTASVEYDGMPPAQFAVEANVVTQFPGKIEFPDVARATQPERRARIRSLSSRPIRVKGMEYDRSFFEIAAVEEGNDSLIVVRPTKDIPFGGFDKHVTVATDDPETAEMRIRICGRVLRPLEADDLVSFGEVDPGTTAQVELHLRSPYGGPISVSGIESQPKGFVTADLSRVWSEGEVTILPVALTGDFDGLVHGAVKVCAKVGDSDETANIEFYAMKRAAPEHR